MKINNIRVATLASIVLVAALTRLLPHPFNFTPIGAIALFGGAYFSKKYLAFLIPLSAMLLSDALLGFHNSMWAVYLSFVLIVAIGMGLLQKVTAGRVFGSALLSSVLFFVVTNFAVWYGSAGFYPQTLSGLGACYLAGLQFYQQDFFGNLFFNTVLGDLFFSSVLFGAFEALKSQVPSLKAA
ncbi:DUF6580 family putative transport protein [Persicitalea jodogahamensis]|uniref:Uncharacterized protein n=1 Tax=Persicitalea jodogahamensis TaxID=402147 RepID=A0A8J3DA79_9BACT|nr:DUF6580 family putative transport protein [Persicitalea jodogahamensis]GHB81489.1 hypothetical protein GCM10007390_40470 [Persicitalea jodogahamensis]